VACGALGGTVAVACYPFTRIIFAPIIHPTERLHLA
jgi:hypothetical protein